jgi:hypothetical protein
VAQTEIIDACVANGLCHQPGLGRPGVPNTRLGNELTRAANDYMLKRWVGAPHVFTRRIRSGSRS